MEITRNIVSERDQALIGGDFAAYHAKATRKVHTLRTKLGIATPRGRKYSPKSPATAENIAQNVQWVQLLLMSAERAWADAMAMKSLQSPENTRRPMAGSTKKQIVSRYRRAINYASNLLEALLDSTSQSSQTDVLEAKAYLALLKGGLDFEQSRWSSCIQNYAIARIIYSALDSTSRLDAYKDLLSSTIDPSIRYAAYQSKLPRTKALQDISVERFPANEMRVREEVERINPQAFEKTTDRTPAQEDTPSNLPTTITWRSRKVKIEDASISQALGISQDKEMALAKQFQQFSKAGFNSKEIAVAYEEIIDARQEAADLAKTTIDELRSQGVDQGDMRIQSLQVTRTAINYAVIEWRIGRNRILCGKDDGLTFDMELERQNLSKPHKDGKRQVVKEESTGRKLARLRERTTLYDSILQSLDAVRELPGVIADLDLTQEIDAKKKYFRALKCLAIGRSHSLSGDLKNALALLSYACELVKHASSSLRPTKAQTNDPPKLDVTSSQLDTARELLTPLTQQYHGLVNLEELSIHPASKGNALEVSLIERFHLNQYNEDTSLSNLVNYPPRLQPVPVKPLFFDLAWNYIQYPGEEPVNDTPAVETKHAEKKDEKSGKRGWFGFGGR